MTDPPPIPTAFEAGAQAARADIAANRLRLHHAARGHWGDDLIALFAARFNVEIVPTTCLVTEPSTAFETAYNAEVEVHVDRLHGPGAVVAALAEVERRRQAAYDAWAARERT